MTAADALGTRTRLASCTATSSLRTFSCCPRAASRSWILGSRGAGGAAVADDRGTGRCCGTPRVYVAGAGARPDVDQRSDLFSLGVVLFEMLAGKRAFDAGGGPRWFDAFTRCWETRRTIPGWVRTRWPLCARRLLACFSDPDALSGCGEFQQALAEVLHDVEPTLVPVPAPPQPPRPSRRAVIGAVVALLAVVGLGGAAWRWGWAKIL